MEFRAQLQDLWKENREREEVRWRHALGRRLLACFDQLKLMAAHCGLNPDLPLRSLYSNGSDVRGFGEFEDGCDCVTHAME